MLTLKELLSRLRLYLEDKSDFASVRNWVYQFYEAEASYRLDDALEAVFPVLLSYLPYEEAGKDSKRDVRMRRVYELLKSANSAFTERTIFALEYDDVRELTKKLSDALITNEMYQKKMAMLSPVPYNAVLLIHWTDAMVILLTPPTPICCGWHLCRPRSFYREPDRPVPLAGAGGRTACLVTVTFFG